MDALRSQYAELFLDGGVYSRHDGFHCAVLLVDEHENSAQSMTLWRDRAAFDALAATDAYRASMSSLAQHFVGTPEVTERSYAAYFPTTPGHG